MKQCPQCGHAANDNENFCRVCGAALSQTGNEALNTANTANSASTKNTPNNAQAFQQPVQTVQPAQPIQGTNAAYAQTAPKTATTKKEFLKLEENKKLYKSCQASAVFCYCCAAFLLIKCLIQKDWFSIADVIIIIGLGLGIHFKQSRVCAIILLVYASISTTYTLITNGLPGGLLLLAAGIFGVIYTFSIHNKWKEYQQQQTYQQQTGQQPPFQQ